MKIQRMLIDVSLIDHIELMVVICKKSNEKYLFFDKDIICRYVKRALPFDVEHPREHIESTRDLMIINDCLNVDELFLKELREYFSFYGTLYACKCCRDENFEYILVEFADFGKINSHLPPSILFSQIKSIVSFLINLIISTIKNYTS